MRGVNERRKPSSSSSSSSSPNLDCDVGLGLKMQQPTHHHHHNNNNNNNEPFSLSCSSKRDIGMAWPFYMSMSSTTSPQMSNANVTGYGGDGGGPYFSNQVSCGGDFYQQAAAAAAAVSDATSVSVLQRTFHNTSPAAAAFTLPSGQVAAGEGFLGMAVSGKAPNLFTATQLEELERQKAIHKHMMASVPLPPEFLLPILPGGGTTALTPSLPLHHYPSLSQSNTNMRYPSGGSDPEPWRCKRTDGKKWRCSRDVAPDQKYCERHAHKTRPRSRKPVEPLPSQINPSSTSSNNNGYNTNNANFILPPAAAPSPKRPPPAATSYDQTRGIEWLMRGGSSNSSSSGSMPVSTRTSNTQQQQQWQQQHTSSRFESVHEKNSSSSTSSVYQPLSNLYNMWERSCHQEQQPQVQYDPCLSNLYHMWDKHPFDGGNGNASMNANASDRTQQTTRHFIDAWEKFDRDTSSPSAAASLTLSMSGGNEDRDYEKNGQYLGIGTMRTSDRERDSAHQGILNLNPNPTSSVCWMTNSFPIPPGGPLGEALCLGNSSTARGNNGNSLSSPHGLNSSSKSSCEDGSHALNFIG